MEETWVESLGQENPMEKEMAIHSSIPAGKFPRQRSLGVTVHGVTKSQTWLSDWATTATSLYRCLLSCHLYSNLYSLLTHYWLGTFAETNICGR